MVKANGSTRLIKSPPITACKRWTFRLITVAVTSLLGILVIIIVMAAKGFLVLEPESSLPRVQAPPLYLQEPGHDLTGHKYVYDSKLGWCNIPGWQATTHGNRLTINTLGFRGREITEKKPNNVTRIMILGDSYAWGYGVADDEVFPSVLEKDLNQTGRRFEVLNTGVSGWGTDQQYLFYVHQGQKFEPDIVVLAFFLINDPKNNIFSTQYGLNKPLFLDTDLTLGNVPVPKPDDVSFRKTSTADPVSLTLAIVRELAGLCSRQNRPLIVLKFGLFLRPPGADLYQYDRQFKTAMTQMPNLHFLDLDQAFLHRLISKQQLLVGNDDGHWNAFGHRVTAEVLAQYITEQLEFERW